MGKSFFTGADAELYTGLEVFATKIAATPTDYGLTAPMAADYGTLNVAWRSAYEAIVDPQTRTKGKIAAKNAAAAAVRARASDLAKIIEGTSTVSDEQKIDLGLSVRATPTPMPPPGTPNAFKVALSIDGAVELKWKCNNPAGSTGTMYQLWRRNTPEGEFTYLGGTGERSFTDETLAAGSSQVTYQVQAVRSTAVGPFTQVNVNFGVGAGGAGAGGAMMAPSVVESTPTPPKLAA